MDYFGRIVDQSFHETEDGRTVFLPWGLMGDGYVVDSPERYRRIRGEIRAYVSTWIPAVLGLAIGGFAVTVWLSGWHPDALLVLFALVAAVLAASWIHFAWKVPALVEGLEPTDERPDVRSRFRSQVWMPTAYPKLHSANAWAAVTCVISLTGLWLLYPDADPRVLGLAAGAVTLTVYLVRLRTSG